MNHPRASVAAEPTSTVSINHPTLGDVRAFRQPDGSWCVAWTDGNWSGCAANLGTIQPLADGGWGATALNQSAVYGRFKRAVYWVADRHAEVIHAGEQE